ncbi:MAG TPA: CPXCG motif-containing cysteine-rich protein [Dongiaceae bacterium]|nr:CPXCG motif-containing cysteine-rich protein [Dongiaceae bacterium]
MNRLEEVQVQCPYCGEDFTILVDCSEPEQSYVEDCQVCCRPIQMDVNIDGEAVSVFTHRDDD